MANFILHIVLVLLLFTIGEDEARKYVGYIYIIQYAAFLYTINKKNTQKLITPYLKPSFLILTYICLYFFSGSLYVNAGNGIFKEMVDVFFKVKNFVLVNVFFIVCNYIVFVTGMFVEKKYSKFSKYNFPLKDKISFTTVFLCTSVFLLFSFVELDLTFLGGSGSFSYLPKLVSALIIFMFLSSQKIKLRMIYYLLIMVVFAMASFESKREIIFIFISIVYIENLFNPIKFDINLRTGIMGAIGFGLFTFFILVSSITRGYGNYNAGGFIEAIKYVPSYVESDIFVDALGDNFEINVVYVNALNAADMYMSGNQETLYGETFLKALFIPIPKSVFDYKPNSMIVLYSPRVYTGRDYYITYPVIIYSELLWNFGLLFIPFLFFIVWVLDMFYYKMSLNTYRKGFTVSSIVLLVLYTINMQFIRGSGLDLLILYIIVAIPFSWFLIKMNNFFVKKNG